MCEESSSRLAAETRESGPAASASFRRMRTLWSQHSLVALLALGALSSVACARSIDDSADDGGAVTTGDDGGATTQPAADSGSSTTLPPVTGQDSGGVTPPPPVVDAGSPSSGNDATAPPPDQDSSVPPPVVDSGPPPNQPDANPPPTTPTTCPNTKKYQTEWSNLANPVICTDGSECMQGECCFVDSFLGVNLSACVPL